MILILPAACLAEETSETSVRLRQGLEQYPAADANGDGVLTMTEARAFLAARKAKGSTPRKRPAPKEVDLTTVEKTGKGLWVASTGHSLVAPALEPFGRAAASAGLDGHRQIRQLSGGASGAPRSHWEKPDSEQVVKRALATGKCDVLTMGSHSVGSEVEDFARWIDLGLKHNPEMVFFVQDAWPYLTELFDVKGNKTADSDADFERYATATDRFGGWIAERVDALNDKYPGKVHVIPIGGAMRELVRRQLAGELPGVDAVYVPGRKDAEPGKGQLGLYRDNIHPTGAVEALEGYLYYACIYKQNPVDLPQGVYPNSELDQILREVAWKTVIEHPRSGVTGD